MHNMVYLIGNMEEITTKKLDDEVEVGKLKIKVRRSYKDMNGEYLSDILEITLYNHMIEETKKYCHPGDLISVKGRIQYMGEDLSIIADKISFLLSNKEDQ